jgi:hypothetical protein
MDTEQRLQSLEHSYSRLADSVHRIATAVETVQSGFETLEISLAGKINKVTGKFTPGYIQKLDDVSDKQEKCLAKQKNRTRYFLSWAKDLLLIGISAFLAYKGIG